MRTGYQVVPVSEIIGDDQEETSQLEGLLQRARGFISDFCWNDGIITENFGYGVADLLGIFLFEIQPSSSNFDQYLWVVVGDLPSAYLVLDNAPEPSAALKAYIAEMRKWVRGVEMGGALSGIIPVNVPPTQANAAMLKSRLEFLETHILPRCQSDLAARA